MVLRCVSARVLASQFFSGPTSTRIGPSFRVGSSSYRGSYMASDRRIDSDGVSEREWQGWGTSSPLPDLVAEIVGDLRSLEKDSDEQMTFGGLGGKLQGDFKVKEDKKHRAVYQALTDSETKHEFFSARQVACRLLGSRGYLCQKCWLPAEDDCLCLKLVPCSLWRGIRFWLYMHPKDFLRQNNTGKLLWQIFGIHSASMCLFGIREQEEIMWDTFRQSGKNMVWFLYPNKNASPKSVQDIFDISFNSEDRKMHNMLGSSGVLFLFGAIIHFIDLDLAEKTLHFVLIDGTWSNSAAMYRRMKEKWTSLWGEEDLPCLSLSTTGASVMHRLRPQPSWDRTCTAAAAAGLLLELNHHCPELSLHELDKQADAIEEGLDVLLDALTARRLRMGRSVALRVRKQQLQLKQ